jgi:hypothetical protein
VKEVAFGKKTYVSKKCKLWIVISGISLLLLTITLGGCNNISPEDITPQELNTTHTNTLVERGESLYDDVSSSYTELQNSDSGELAKGFGDYALFPNDWTEDSTFSDRMKAVYWADDNIVQSVEAFTESDEELETSSNQRFVGLAISAFSAGMKVYQDHKRNKLIEMQGQRLKQIENMMKAQNLQLEKQHAEQMEASRETQQKIDAMEANISNQLSNMQQDLKGEHLETQMMIDDFRSEVRVGFSEVHNGINTIITNVAELQNDVNIIRSDLTWLTELLLSEAINEPKNRIEGFYDGFASIAGSFDQTYDYAKDIEPDLEFLRREFIAAAVKIQENALQKGLITDTYWNDETTTLTRYRADITHSGGTDTYNFDFPSPKKLVAISYGNLEYLYKITMTRFIVNQTLYTGSELAETNANAAQFYLESLNDEQYNVKGAAEDAAVAMHDELVIHLDHIDDGFTNLYSGITDVSYKVKDSTGTWVSVPELDGLSGDDLKATVKELVAEAYIGVYAEYMGPYLGELQALETELMAYAEEDN